VAARGESGILLRLDGTAGLLLPALLPGAAAEAGCGLATDGINLPGTGGAVTDDVAAAPRAGIESVRAGTLTAELSTRTRVSA
jgi:hypothetical protein